MATRKQRQKAAKKRQGSTKPGKNAKRQRTRAQKKSRRRPKGKANKQRRTAGAKPPMPSRRPATSGKDTAKMNDYFGGMSPKDLEDLARRLIEQGPEGHKVDFKVALNLSGNAEKAEFAKDVSSIANTDDEVHLDDFGYLIVGAKRNQLLGGVAELAGNTDKLQADLTDVLKNFLLPVPSFSVVAFNDPTLGPWGVLVVQPSVRQPHIFIRDGADVVKHEWWVRINDTKDRAGALDYARVMAKAVRREVRPLERELQRLQLLINQRRDLPDLEGVLATLRNQEATPDASSTQEGIVAQVRRLLVKGNSQVEDGLVAEALRVAEVMGGTSENNPWLFRDMTPEKLREILSYLEEQTFPLAEALATIARYDNRGELLEGVRRAFKVIAREPQPSGIHYSYISQFRLYPLVLCIYAVVVVAVAERRRDLLKAVFELSVFHADGASSDPLVAAVRRLRAAQDVFKEATERNYIEAVAERVKEVLLPRLGPLLAGEAPADAFFVAEFVLSLAFLPVSPTYYGAATKATLPGSYFYYWDARRAVSVFLKGRPTWLGDALGEPLSDLLVDFDRAATRAIDSRAFGANGFVSGAAEAFEGKAPTP